jgi:hypothetical protein
MGFQFLDEGLHFRQLLQCHQVGMVFHQVRAAESLGNGLTQHRDRALTYLHALPIVGSQRLQDHAVGASCRKECLRIVRFQFGKLIGCVQGILDFALLGVIPREQFEYIALLIRRLFANFARILNEFFVFQPFFSKFLQQLRPGLPARSPEFPGAS